MATKTLVDEHGETTAQCFYLPRAGLRSHCVLQNQVAIIVNHKKFDSTSDDSRNQFRRSKFEYLRLVTVAGPVEVETNPVSGTRYAEVKNIPVVGNEVHPKTGR